MNITWKDWLVSVLILGAMVASIRPLCHIIVWLADVIG